ncbi:MAG: 23S rRNA (pseudouridine1915-N3)-methyltransferase [Cellvibrionaceae bacterium]|jgi:23S rRNA (pseudouridine1915-N3)-methyltransferase
MRLRIIAVGTKMPSWVTAGVSEYQKRLPREWKLEWLELPIGQRSKSQDINKAIRAEGESILSALGSKERVIALEVNGKAWSTEQLAEQVADWQMMGQDTTLLIGGPDGLSASCRERAETLWSLSPLTLPHPLVRILLMEQLYRAWSLINNHPYHK